MTKIKITPPEKKGGRYFLSYGGLLVGNKRGYVTYTAAMRAARSIDLTGRP